MKKVKCEVCGSNEIRKTADDVFVCQQCGIQYRTEDMSKLLVENEEPPKVEEMPEVPVEQESLWDNCHIAEAAISPQDNIKHFLSYLEKVDNIACDIYKEISIEQTKAFYFPFFLVKGRYVVDWSAIACHIYYENETVYVKRFDANLGDWVKEPTTRQVERVQRTPRNGKQNRSCSSFVAASMALKNLFGEISAGEKTKLLEAFQEQQTEKFDNGKLKPFEKTLLKQRDGLFYYGNLELLNETDINIANDEKGNLRKRAKSITRTIAQNDLNGGTFENYSSSQTILSESVSLVYVPVQIITYLYKGQRYAAVSDLISTTSTVPAIYPIDKDFVQMQEQMNQETKRANGRSALTILGLVTCALEMLALLFMGLINYQEETGIFTLFAAMLVSLIVLICGVSIEAKRRSKNRQNQDSAFADIHMPRKIALHKGKEACLAAYPNAAVIEMPMPKVGQCGRALHASVAVEYYGQTAPQEEKMLEIHQLQQEIRVLEKKRIVPVILMTVFGVLIIPLIIGTILLGNVNAKINQKRFLINNLKDECLKL